MAAVAFAPVPLTAQESKPSPGDFIGGAAMGGIVNQAIRNAPSVNRSSKRAYRTAPRRIAPVKQTRESIRSAQISLAKLGFDAGTPDGVAGARTRAAISEFQTRIGAEPTGRLSQYDSYVLERAAREAERGATSDYAIGLALGTMCGSYGLLENCMDRIRASGQIRYDIAGPTVTRTTASGTGTPRLAAAGPDRGPASRPATPATRTVRSTSVPIPTRMFSGPDQIPPEGFRGYGIVAFKSDASASNAFRHTVICEAYNAAMLPSGGISNPTESQFVTIWPLTSGETADKLNRAAVQPGEPICDTAISAYDRVRAEEALLLVRAKGFAIDGIGPYLFGWLPGESYVTGDAPILSLDLSQVRSFAQAQALFSEWKTDVMSDPELLRDGFSAEVARRKIRRWADSYGEGFLSLVGF
ncbi:peptidoglycan-binding domain-containing protein [Sulfitobacter sp. D35]|uniref:peptidoglycan-binding domain-containing protein n=1 Tax=Sulfitobacter sp. D35 TaxID=3083252 RepID=UPI00296F4FF0|nr:peptidoglycan-binding domain-containing protein [Sulfitobacter sp. D35]MDW4497053.1 peptidoglycan-binding domain-containing protein [Sulfitobacter sp. D35]